MTISRRTLLHLAAGAATLLLAPALRAQDASPVRPFHITSLGSPFAVQGDFRGEYQINGDQIHLNVTRAVLVMNKQLHYTARRDIKGIQLGLSRLVKGQQWDMVSSGNRSSIHLVLTPETQIDLQPFRVTIALSQDAPLPEHWLTAKIYVTTVVNGKDQDGFAYAHSPSNIFRIE